MRCPFCGGDDTQVKDSRPTEDNAAIRRRRQCQNCDARFTTFERVQLRELTVVKRGGKRVPFDRDKLARSVDIALRRRPVDPQRVEQIVKEEAIQHEIKTYNELIGEEGELGCVLLIEIADAQIRPQKLREWLGLQEKIYLVLDSGEWVYAEWDKRQIDDEKLSSVQYLKFDTSGRTPKRIGVDHPELQCEMDLSEEQRGALNHDLQG